MSDILRELRGHEHLGLTQLAADEIEALRAAVDALARERERLRDEVSRIRLEQCAACRAKARLDARSESGPSTQEPRT